MRRVVPVSALFFAGMVGLAGMSPAAENTPPLVVVPTHVNPRFQGQIAVILSEFNIATVIGVVGRVPTPTAKIRGAILRVLADQKLIPDTTPGIGSVPSDAFRIQVMYTLQQFGVLNQPSTVTVGGGATAPTSIGTNDIVDGAVTAPKISPGAVGTLELADGSVTTPKLANAAVTAIKVNSEQASSGMSLVADGAGGAQWSFPAPLPNSIPDSALSNNVALLNAAQTFTKTNTFNPGGSDVSALLVKQTSAASPTQDVFTVSDSAGATKFLNVDKSGNTSVSGVLSGIGSGLTTLNGSAISSGTVAVARLPVATTSALGVVQPDGTSITITGGGVISANAAGVTLGGDVTGAANANTIAAGAVTGAKIAANTIGGGNLAVNISISTTGNLATTGSGTITSAGLLTASNGLTLSGGTLSLPNASVADSALSNNVALLNAAQTFSNTNTFNPGGSDVSALLVKQTSAATPSQDVFTVSDSAGATKFLNVDKSGNTSVSGVLSGIGSGLTTLNGSAISSGTVAVARLPVATTSALGVVQPDGTSITITGGGVISANAAGVTLGGDVTGAANANTIAAGAVTGAKIAANTIAGGNLATNITISTTGNISTTGAGTITSAGLLKASNGFTLSAGALTLPNASIADTALSANVPLKNAANTFTGANTFSALVKANAGLTVAGALTLPNASVADTALSANVPLKNAANTFTGANTFSALVKANAGLTVAGALTLPNASVADTALSANVPLKNAANTFTGANTFSGLVKANAGLTVVGALTLPNTSIADTALSANVPLKNGANAFTNINTFTNTGLNVFNPAGTFSVNLRPAAETANRIQTLPDAAGTVQLASTSVVAVAGNTTTAAGGVSVLVLNNGGAAASYTLTLTGLANGQILVVKNNAGQAITKINGKTIAVATGQSQLLYVDNGGAVNRAAAALTFP